MSNTKRLEAHQPILTNADLEKIRSISDVAEFDFKSLTLDATWPAESGAGYMQEAIAAAAQRRPMSRCATASTSSFSDRRAR